MIDATATIDSLTAIVRDPDGIPGLSSSKTAEDVDAATYLRTLTVAAAAYETRLGAVANWRTSYQQQFTLLDRRARYVLSLTTTAPDALAFADDEATHDALEARADTAAGTAVSAPVLADLARFRAAFDTAWSAKPADPDASAEGVALLAAIDAATGVIGFMLWARANPA